MDDVGETVIPFGMYKGKSLNQIASDNAGLRYLDWLRGQEWLRDPLCEAIEEYLDDPVVSRELDQALEERER